MDSISLERTVPAESVLEMLSDKGEDKSLISGENPDTTLNATLNYIRKILLEDDVEEKEALLHEELVSAIEKPFYDILSKNYPNTVNISEILQIPRAILCSTIQNFSHLPGSGDSITVAASKFDKGFSEGMKFLPNIGELSVNLTENNLFVNSSSTNENEEDKDEVLITSGSRGKKKSINVDNWDNLEGRIRKVSMLCSEETARRSTLLDEVLLQHDDYMKIISKLKGVNLRAENNYAENDQGEVDNLKKLLIRCSEAVYANNRESAEELIEQIRNRSSLDGDGIQRMGFLYADALEARLTGTGGEAWRRICRKRFSTSEFAKSAQLYVTACPFPRIHTCCSNRTILKAAERASVLHVVDFGVGFGFQWPSLIQAKSAENANATKLRITGIDFPRPGFRPAEHVDETGRRLEDYARSFNVPFEYRGITSNNWGDISMDELNIKNDELLIVNCMYRFRDVGDEAVSLDSPRDRVLKLIYQMKPHIFIEGVLNIRSLSPFFVSRFRQSLPLYLSLFEILDLLIPRDNKPRKMIEREIFGRDIMNVIACEGLDWTMKPESYKQWHRRTERAGFEQVALDPAIVKECREYLRKLYNNKIFFIEEDGNWLLQGWSGIAWDALSIWKPKLA